MADQDPTLAQNEDAPTPQDQFKPAESHFGQNSPTPGATDIEGLSQNSGGQSMSGTATAGYGQTGFTEEAGGSGQIAGNDQAGGGLGQNHSGYGGDNAPTSGEPEVTSENAERQGSQGFAARSGNVGPSPTGGGQQPRSAITGGPDLSKGLADTNRGGGGF
ncbi:MAG: hypothetical protein KY446_11370 [Proteobacteria bacterium]|nr:hypothetical protein [Pseudomonadota bacterium]